MLTGEAKPIKIVLCGEGGVGKTSIAHRFTKGVFYEVMKITVGIEHFTKVLEVNGKHVNLVLWDLGGEERFRFLAPVFLRGARGGVFVFDVTREDTFLKIDEWYSIYRKYVGNAPAVLVGNKIDLEEFRVIFREHAEDYAKSRGFIGYYEVSAKNNLNIEKPFIELVKHIISEET
ncbi:MAG: GTP-binding protein [Thermoprotei archaeon]|nr:MAG: GTP-binding protein [Thermoprotei archaeon]RLF00782.1 MAG: GTP-binding protein [Thermoprotei archaeon]